MNTTKKVAFNQMSKAQDATKALAVNAGKAWSEKDLTYLENHMFEDTIESIAIALGRTAYSIETKLSKDAHFINLRKKKGDVPTEKAEAQAPVKYNFVSSDLDVLFGTGD